MLGMDYERYYPEEDTMGKECAFWQGVDLYTRATGQMPIGCFYPKAEMVGRISCEGIIDDVCLFLKSGRIPRSLNDLQIEAIRQRVPGASNIDLPPGGTKK